MRMAGSAIRRPAYDRSRVTPGIVHLGLGAFHRAHQAVVIDDCLATGAASWGIVGASLRSSDTRDALAPQDCLYTVAVRSGAGTEHRVVGSVLETEVAREDPARLIARMADPVTRIVSLTVTEKGYCHTPQTGELDEQHPDIVHDLKSPDAPRSAAGFIVAAMARRKAAGVAIQYTPNDKGEHNIVAHVVDPRTIRVARLSAHVRNRSLPS